MAEVRPRVFLASRNAKKLAEMQRILEPFVPHIEVLGLDDVEHYDEPAETEPTFAGNALLKARAGVAATGLPALADDSGLCVDALDGAPGLYSARYAGEPSDAARNIEKLLAALDGMPEAQRGAHFHCTLVLLRHADDPRPLIAQGEWHGRVLAARRGTGGFGYDPIFLLSELGKTMAEL